MINVLWGCVRARAPLPWSALDWEDSKEVNVAEIGKRKKTTTRYVYMFSCVAHVYLCVYIYNIYIYNYM